MFKLDIYTWPAMMGAPCGFHESTHRSPEQAISHLEAQSEPYAYAVLSKQGAHGWTPCDWDGNEILGRQEWPQRTGTNRDHPATVAFKADWGNLVKAILKQKSKQPKCGLIDIAREILQKRHPQIVGMAEHLANDAFDQMK